MSLNGDVQCRCRFVGDEEVGIVGERHGDHDALALAARQLVRISVQTLFRLANADLAQQLERAHPSRLFRHATMHTEDLSDLPLDGVQRVERSHGFLEHHGDVGATHLPQCLLRRAQQILALEQDLAGRMPSGRIVEKLHDR